MKIKCLKIASLAMAVSGLLPVSASAAGLRISCSLKAASHFPRTVLFEETAEGNYTFSAKALRGTFPEDNGFPSVGFGSFELKTTFLGTQCSIRRAPIAKTVLVSCRGQDIAVQINGQTKQMKRFNVRSTRQQTYSTERISNPTTVDTFYISSNLREDGEPLGGSQQDEFDLCVIDENAKMKSNIGEIST